MPLLPQDYKMFLASIKSKIKTAQLKAQLKVNQEMLRLYWDIGLMIVEK